MVKLVESLKDSDYEEIADRLAINANLSAGIVSIDNNFIIVKDSSVKLKLDCDNPENSQVSYSTDIIESLYVTNILKSISNADKISRINDNISNIYNEFEIIVRDYNIEKEDNIDD